MRGLLITVLAACIGLAGPGTVAGAGLFSATGAVIAIVADDLFLGEAEGHLGGAGTLAIGSQKNPQLTCLGRFISSPELRGSVQLQCSDGATATFQFQRLSIFSGHGVGSSSRGPMSFTYGLTALESASYLKLPPGNKLAHNGSTLELVGIPPPTVVASRQDAAPDALLRGVTADVFAIIRREPDLRDGDPAKLATLVETEVLAHFNFSRMTQLAMGRNWRQATADQQKTLTLAFRTLLVRTYAVALSAYRDHVIEYRPLRVAPDATEVTVRSDVKRAGRERIAIDYEMEKTPAGWKVCDIKIAGTSLVATYRDTFAGKVRDGGIEGLIKSLSDRNLQGGLKTVNSGS